MATLLLPREVRWWAAGIPEDPVVTTRCPLLALEDGDECDEEVALPLPVTPAPTPAPAPSDDEPTLSLLPLLECELDLQYVGVQ